jgi:hypothetical protein
MRNIPKGGILSPSSLNDEDILSDGEVGLDDAEDCDVEALLEEFLELFRPMWRKLLDLERIMSPNSNMTEGEVGEVI